jgi:hypothetical protein
MHNDIYPSIHADDMGPVIGTFNGEPVRSYDATKSEARQARDARMTVLLNLGAGIPAEVLPGEVIVKNTIVRETAAADREVIGIEEMLTSSGSTTHRVSIEEAKKLSAEGACIVWRPEGSAQGVEQYALVVGGVELPTKANSVAA